MLLLIICIRIKNPASNGSYFTPILITISFPLFYRPREETVASIMDIKFCNEVVEILIDNCDTFFPAQQSDSSPEISLGGSRKHKCKLEVLR